MVVPPFDGNGYGARFRFNDGFCETSLKMIDRDSDCVNDSKMASPEVAMFFFLDDLAKNSRIMQ